jgi:hypothetical protein
MKEIKKEPLKPERKIWVKMSKSICVENPMLFDAFLKELPTQHTPDYNIKDLSISGYDDGNWDYDEYYVGLPYIELTWQELMDNNEFDSQMKKYQTKMKKWKQQEEAKCKK